MNSKATRIQEPEAFGRRRVASPGIMHDWEELASAASRALPTAASSSMLSSFCMRSNKSRSSLRMWAESLAAKLRTSPDVSWRFAAEAKTWRNAWCSFRSSSTSERSSGQCAAAGKSSRSSASKCVPISCSKICWISACQASASTWPDWTARSKRTHSASACWCWRDSGIRFLSRSMANGLGNQPAPIVARQIIGARRSLDRQIIRGGRLFVLEIRRAQREPIRAHTVPPLHQQPVSFEELSNAEPIPSYDVFENRRQHSQGISAEHGSFGDMGNMLGFGDCDGEAVSHVHVQHHMHVGTAVAGVNNLIGPNLQLGLQIIEHGYFAISSRGTNHALNPTFRVVAELCSVNVVGGKHSFQRRLNYLHRSRRQNIKVELVAFDSTLKNFGEKLDVFLQANNLSDLIEMFAAHAAAKFRIMKQQIGKLRPLLHQIQLGHPFRFAFEFSRGNANQFAQYIPGIIESERLIKITGKKIAFQKFVSHMKIRFTRVAESKQKTFIAWITTSARSLGSLCVLY